MKKLCLTIGLTLASLGLFAQKTEDALKQEITTKKESITALEGEIAGLEKQILELPGWRVGGFGNIGVNLGGFNNWYNQANSDNDYGNIGVTFNGYANLTNEKYFWRNALNVNLAWVKLDDRRTDADSDNFNASTDVFNLTSLYGFNIGEDIAISALGEYRTSLLQGSFNDPGYLDLGVGATWTPATDLVVVIHPLNYNFVFSDSGSEYESSLGAKIVADYTRKIGNVNFKTNFSSFVSYKDTDLSNWQWTNSFGYTLWKSIGVGFDFGLRQNKQETFNATTGLIGGPATLADTDADLQTFWNVGLNYAF